MTADWGRAACKDADPDLFAALDRADKRADDGGTGRIAAAVAICNRCPIRVECLEAAIGHRDSGVWGGLYLEYGRPRQIVADRTDRRASLLAKGDRLAARTAAGK